LSDVTWLLRHRTLKAFFEYWLVRDALSVLPMPPTRRPGTARTFIPYIYSVSEVRQLLSQAALKRPPRRSHEFSALTLRTLLLFLYGTGARINETLFLRCDDVDLRRGTVTFNRNHGDRMRTIPIGSHLCETLRRYNDFLDPSGEARKIFFVGENRNAIRPSAVTFSFKTLRRKATISRSDGFFVSPPSKI
jgi:integrase/recombinase XerD